MPLLRARGVLSLVLLTTGNVGPSSADKVLGVLNIDLANRVIEHLTGVATGSNA